MDKPAELEDRLVDFAVRIINGVGVLFYFPTSYFTIQQSSIDVGVNWSSGAAHPVDRVQICGVALQHLQDGRKVGAIGN